MHSRSPECRMLPAAAKNYSRSALQLLYIKIIWRTYDVILCRFCINIVSIHAKKKRLPCYYCWRQQYTNVETLSCRHKTGLTLHCFAAAKCLVLLLQTISIKCSECVSVLLSQLSGMQIQFFCGALRCYPWPVWL